MLVENPHAEVNIELGAPNPDLESNQPSFSDSTSNLSNNEHADALNAINTVEALSTPFVLDRDALWNITFNIYVQGVRLVLAGLLYGIVHVIEV
jgi:hypothetical protein